MPRKILSETTELPYHITARGNNREAFPGDSAFLWKAFTSELYLQSILHGNRTHAFVLMPNHFHLLLTVPKVALSKTMREFMSSSTRIINVRNGRSGHVFGGRYHWTIIDNPAYFAHALKYVYRNPVRAGLSPDVASYPFSTFAGIAGSASLPLKITPPKGGLDRLIPGGESIEKLEIWLDQPHRVEESEAIREALKRNCFKLPVSPTSRRAVKLPLD